MKANKALNGRLHFHGFRRRPPPPVLPAIGAAVLASNGGGDFIATVIGIGCRAPGRSVLARSWARRALPPNEIPSRNTSWIFSEYCCGFQAGKFVCLFGESCKDMPMSRKSAVYSKKSRKHHCKPEKTPEKPVFILGSLGSTGPLNVDAERRKMPCAMRAGAVIYSSVFRARC